MLYLVGGAPVAGRTAAFASARQPVDLRAEQDGAADRAVRRGQLHGAALPDADGRGAGPRGMGLVGTSGRPRAPAPLPFRHDRGARPLPVRRFERRNPAPVRLWRAVAKRHDAASAARPRCPTPSPMPRKPSPRVAVWSNRLRGLPDRRQFGVPAGFVLSLGRQRGRVPVRAPTKCPKGQLAMAGAGWPSSC